VHKTAGIVRGGRFATPIASAGRTKITFSSRSRGEAEMMAEVSAIF
jgi:hypothetical protein